MENLGRQKGKNLPRYPSQYLQLFYLYLSYFRLAPFLWLGDWLGTGFYFVMPKEVLTITSLATSLGTIMHSSEAILWSVRILIRCLWETTLDRINLVIVKEGTYLKGRNMPAETVIDNLYRWVTERDPNCIAPHTRRRGLHNMCYWCLLLSHEWRMYFCHKSNYFRSDVLYGICK